MKLEERAVTIYPDSATMQQKWVAAVQYLRTCSAKGYALDKLVGKQVSRPVLHGYTAVEPMKTVTVLPDEQIIPPEKIVRGPWKK